MNPRPIARAFAAAFAATLVMTGCEPAVEPDDAPAAPTEPATPTEPAEPALRWDMISSDEGSALVLLGEGDRQVFHLACLAEPARMAAIGQDFTVIGSEERLTLGVDNEAFGLVADTLREEPGVRAEGAIDPVLLERFLVTEEVSAVYGAQRVGPWDAPPETMRRDWVAACRDLAGIA